MSALAVVSSLLLCVSGVSSHAAVEALAAALVRPFAPGVAAPVGAVSATCRNHSSAYLAALEDLQPWAMLMYDSSAHLSPGVLTGDVMQLGHSDECVSAAAPQGFSGRLCTAVVWATLPPLGSQAPTNGSLRELINAAAVASNLDPSTLSSTVHYEWALCVPSTCQASDVAAEMTALLSPLTEDSAPLHVTVEPSECVIRSEVPVSISPQLIVLTVVSTILLSLVVTGTIVDVLPLCSGKIVWRRTLTSFSLRTSWRSLFRRSGFPDQIDCLHGARFLSICWILLGHSYYMTAIRPLINSINITEWHHQWYRMVLMNGTVCTDTFLVLGGCLLSVGWLRGRPQPWRQLVLRYLRLTPPYALVILLYAAVLPIVGSGPRWERVIGPETNNCVHYWWTNLLYINNYVHLDNPCMNQTWYLAVDMQLFVVSVPLLCLLAWRPRYGRIALALALVAAVLTPAVITGAYGLTGAMLYATDDAMLYDVFRLVYTPMHTRATPYVVGLWLGYILHQLRGKPLDLATWQEVLLWLLSCAVFLADVPSALPLYAAPSTSPPPQPWSPLYAGLQRQLWSMAVAWLLLACAKGRAPPLNWLLSLPVFKPLAALTYCVYLTHYAILLYVDGSVQTAGSLADFDVVQHALGTLVLSLGASLILHLTVELPAMALSKELLRPPQKVQRDMVRNFPSKDKDFPNPLLVEPSFNGGPVAANSKTQSSTAIGDLSSKDKALLDPTLLRSSTTIASDVLTTSSTAIIDLGCYENEALDLDPEMLRQKTKSRDFSLDADLATTSVASAGLTSSLTMIRL